MRVIAIETSGTVASVSVVNDKKVECEFFLNNKLQHSTVLFPIIENVLNSLGIKINDLDGVAVSGGPGSFTGLRIGVATGKGLVQGSNRKFIGISTLDTLAYQNSSFDYLMCPIMDALHDNVYTALYTLKENDVEKVLDYDAIHIDELLEKLKSYNKKIIFEGDACIMHKEKIKEVLKDMAVFSLPMNNMPRASTLGVLAVERLSKGIEDSIFTFSPIYIRKSQAEREYEAKMGIKE